MYWAWLVLSFRGRISRMQFGLGLGFAVGILLFFHGLGGFVTLLWPSMSLNWLDACLAVFMVCALLALLVKRLRDAGMSATWLWLNVLPGGGTLLLLCVVLLRGSVSEPAHPLTVTTVRSESIRAMPDSDTLSDEQVPNR